MLQWSVCLDCSSTGIVCSNACLCLCVLCCPVYVEAQRRADPTSNGAYEMSKGIQESGQEPENEGP